MQERRFTSFCLLALYTAFHTVCPSDVQTISSESTEFNSDKPDVLEEVTIEEQKSELVGVTLSAEAQLIESAKNRGALKGTNETTVPSTSSTISLYSLTKDGDPCILLQVDGSLTFKYKTKSGDDKEYSGYLPPDARTSGDCSEEDSATLVLKWKSYVLIWNFAKTPGHERWYVTGVTLNFNTTEKPFQNINRPGSLVLKTAESTKLFPTPVGKSYSCQSETSVELQDGDVTATVFLREFKLQPFISKSDFGPEYECSPGGGLAFRDETAPIAVGSTLAVVVLLTVTGYGVYRYVKIKKVQYDTME